MELEGRTRRHANRPGRRIAIAPTPFNKVGETALTFKPVEGIEHFAEHRHQAIEALLRRRTE